MRICTRLLSLTLAAVIGSGSFAHAQSSAPPPSNKSGRSTALWTVGGAGAGFGIGLWAGLTKYDDAIDSDRKVWTSAVVGAAIGAAGGYLISRLRNRRPRPAISEKALWRSHASPSGDRGVLAAKRRTPKS